MTEHTAASRGEAARAFWRATLLAGGLTPIPRWTAHPVPGVHLHEETVPDDLADALDRLASEQAVPFGSVLLAAHAAVLAALSGDREVVTGLLPDGGQEPLPCRLVTGSGSWRALLRKANRAEADVRAYRYFPVRDLQRELRLSGPSFETVLDPAGAGGPLDGDTVLWVGFVRRDGRSLLRLRYRADALDEGAAARIAGYHRTALAAMAADPDAEHRRQSLLSAEEFRSQIDGLAGPDRELPDRRFHELFEQRVRMHPDAVAAVQGDRRWSYRELNAHANRLGRTLLARGVHREDVVAVMTERTLDWLAAVLAIFKAGGVYLPIEPQFPADRIATMLARAECEFVLTEPGSAAALDRALTTFPNLRARAVAITDAYAEEDADGDLGVEVAPEQLAYICFTSDSTGEPTGAMCEHAGMLNHLYAKIDELGIGEGQVVAQTAPQSFDISLWQLAAALLAGGRTLLVGQDAVLDVARFVDTIVAGRVGVLQVVPSYLDAVLSYLERHPRTLPDLRCVAVTGGALEKELVRRWFSIVPGIPLVNAYGLTETSDDTTHEVLDRVPDTERVPIGRPIPGVHVYIVDEHLSPVPLGAPGEIVFSGVCVGRGYVNDRERSRLAFMPDPHREDQRLYRSGDRGRWLPGGGLEFLGRRDSQVEIRGFRVEIGEIESTLRAVPGVRDAAVVVLGRGDDSRHLVGFYVDDRAVEVAVLRDRLAASLPEYVVPLVLHRREELPLTANGTVDRRALTTLAAELDATPDAAPNPAEENHTPWTPTERRLAATWAEVLGIPADQIGRQDDFFDLGGTSLSAVKLAVALHRAVSLKDLTRHPVLTDLAGLLDDRSARHAALLQPLSKAGDARAGTLICFPHAGGNAVNFQPMAVALRGSGPAVYAVELPGHDLGAAREPFAPLPEVVERVVDEIISSGVREPMLWGHSSGAAFAVATARRLQERGRGVRRVFIGAQLLGDAPGRRAAIGRLTGRTAAELAAELVADGYPELGELDGPRAEQVGAAFQHDCVSAHRYLADVLQAAAAGTSAARLVVAPITVVVAADDPHTAGFRRGHRDWQLLAEDVDLHEIADGGHYFIRTRPAEAADAVLRSAELLAS